MEDNKILIGVNEAANILDIGRSKLYEMHSSGRLGPMPIRLGRSLKWRRSEMLAWIEAGCPSRERWRWKGGAA